FSWSGNLCQDYYSQYSITIIDIQEMGMQLVVYRDTKCGNSSPCCYFFCSA
ncbi:hypothetical protein MKX03_032478, partial [Papaver bracteatum]